MQPNDSLEGGSHSDSLSPAGRRLGSANEEIADITPALKLVRVAPAGGGGTVGVPALCTQLVRRMTAFYGSIWRGTESGEKCGIRRLGPHRQLNVRATVGRKRVGVTPLFLKGGLSGHFCEDVLVSNQPHVYT